jgi:hypothetical protein
MERCWQGRDWPGQSLMFLTCSTEAQFVPRRQKLSSKKWRDLILLVWHGIPSAVLVCHVPFAICPFPIATRLHNSALGCGFRRYPGLNPKQLPEPCKGFNHHFWRLPFDGGEISLRSPQGRIIDVVKFSPQKNGVSMGRYPDGADGWHDQKTVTKGTPNSGLRVPEVVINEIMYNSPWGEDYEYVELRNTTATAKTITGWRLEGGISSPLPTSIPGNGYVIAAKYYSALVAAYGSSVVPEQYSAQWTSGTLANNGERVILQNAAHEPDCGPHFEQRHDLLRS